MSQSLPLRAKAEDLAAALPPLLAEAEHLAATVILGDHGRRRAGLGDTFWQYRAAMPGDEARSIDWRRSARSDAAYVQDKEWQLAQTVSFWVDLAASMRFGSMKNGPTKADRARVLALATSILLIRGGERVGLTGRDLPARRGEAQLLPLAALLSEDGAGDYGAPDAAGMPGHSRAVFISDFLGPIEAVQSAVLSAADKGVRGVLVQILDPQEEAFPFGGRTIFESMGGTLQHETLKARDLRSRYLERLAERKDRLALLARSTAWQVMTHHTDQSPTTALLWIYGALGRSL